MAPQILGSVEQRLGRSAAARHGELALRPIDSSTQRGPYTVERGRSIQQRVVLPVGIEAGDIQGTHARDLGARRIEHGDLLDPDRLERPQHGDALSHGLDLLEHSCPGGIGHPRKQFALDRGEGPRHVVRSREHIVFAFRLQRTLERRHGVGRIIREQSLHTLIGGARVAKRLLRVGSAPSPDASSQPMIAASSSSSCCANRRGRFAAEHCRISRPRLAQSMVANR